MNHQPSDRLYRQTDEGKLNTATYYWWQLPNDGVHKQLTKQGFLEFVKFMIKLPSPAIDKDKFNELAKANGIG